MALHVQGGLGSADLVGFPEKLAGGRVLAVVRGFLRLLEDLIESRLVVFARQDALRKLRDWHADVWGRSDIVAPARSIIVLATAQLYRLVNPLALTPDGQLHGLARLAVIQSGEQPGDAVYFLAVQADNHIAWENGVPAADPRSLQPGSLTGTAWSDAQNGSALNTQLPGDSTTQHLIGLYAETGGCIAPF